MCELKAIAEEFAKFMRGNYCLDEVPGMFYEVPCLKFRQGKKTIVSVNFRKDALEFQIILGKAEREKFENVHPEFSDALWQYYQQQPTHYDGKWLFIRVEKLDDLEEIKKLILLKKRPNRKPFSKENAVISRCGHRCDLCVHSTAITEELRAFLLPHLIAVYREDVDWGMRCDGCGTSKDWCCDAMKCQHEQNVETCFSCVQYPCVNVTAGYRGLESRAISTDNVTWAILPYVPWQYEK